MTITVQAMLYRAAAAVLGLAATVLAASPADLPSSRCSRPYFGHTCVTAEIAAHPDSHFISVAYAACTGSNLRIWDTKSGVLIRDEEVSGEVYESIDGLYSTYRARLYDTCWRNWVELSN